MGELVDQVDVLEAMELAVPFMHGDDQDDVLLAHRRIDGGK